MFDHRSPLTLAAAPAGLALAGALWLVVGVHAPALTRLDRFQTRLGALKPAQAGIDMTADLVRAASVPLFGLTTGPGAVAEAQVRLEGLAITPSLRAALISINGKPSDWLDQGETRDGVTLLEVHPDKITLDTATGFKEVAIEQGGPEPQSASAPSPASAHAPQPPPAAPGMTAPAPPAGYAPFRPPSSEAGAAGAPQGRRFGPLSLMPPGQGQAESNVTPAAGSPRP